MFQTSLLTGVQFYYSPVLANHRIQSSKSFSTRFDEKLGFSVSQLVRFLRQCGTLALLRQYNRQKGGTSLLKEIPVSDRSDTFMTLKTCLCGGEVETVFFSKSCSGSIAQSIKSLFTKPKEGGSKIFFWLQLAVVDLRRYLILAYAPQQGGEKKIFIFCSLSLSLSAKIKVLQFHFTDFQQFFQKISLN